MRTDLDLTFHFIRHAITDKNEWPANDMIGQPFDQPINATGEKQAKALAARIQKSGTKFDHVYSSPYTRAMQTASIAFPEANIIQVPAIREIFQGDGIGKSRKELYSDPEFAAYTSYVGMATKFPNGESLYDVSYRVKSWLEKEILNNTKLPSTPLNIAVISHAMCIKTILYYILDFKHQLCWHLCIDNTSITRVRFKGGEWYIDTMNDTAHLLSL